MSALRQALLLARFDLRGQLREKETYLWVFVMPVVFFYFIGTVTGGMIGSAPGKTRPLHLSVPEDGGFLVDRVRRRLEENDYHLIEGASEEELAGARRHLRLPANFTEAVLSGDGATATLERDESGIGQDLDSLAVGRALYTTLADVVAAAGAEGGVTEDSLAALDEHPRPLGLRVAPAGERLIIPGGYEQAIPGILVMFTMISILTSGAILHVIERRRGLLRRLASTPLSRRTVVSGKWIGQMGMGGMQIAWGVLAGTILFSMDWGPDFWMVLVVLAAWAAFCASLGLLLGSLVNSEGQATAVGVLSTNVLAALGGCWWPIEVTPDWMQNLAKALPTGWTMDAMHRLISFGHGPASALPHTLALLAGSLVLGAIAARRFRFE